MNNGVGNTLNAIELDPQASSVVEFSQFTKDLLDKVRTLKNAQIAYYEHLRKANTKWANGARWVLALLGSIAFLLTGLAAALRILPAAEVGRWADYDKGVLLIILAIYAVMGAIIFYEKATDKTATYFRHLGVMLTIRDLWTKVQFELLKELTTLQNASDRAAQEPAARLRVGALVEAFCSDLNKVTMGELTEWRTEFLASLSELETVAKKGSEDVTKQVQENVKAAASAATEAKAAAEKATAEAKAAAKSAEDATRPGSINIVVTGDFDGEVIIFIDGRESARSKGKKIALERVMPGIRKISAHAKKGANDLEASHMLDVKPGLQDFTIALS